MKKIYGYMAIFLIAVAVTCYYAPVISEKGTYYNQGLIYNIPPFIRAATYGDVDMFKKFIHEGVSIDSEDNDGNTALFLIIMNMNYPHNRKMLDMVLRLHPHMRVKNKAGLMPIHMVSRIDAAIKGLRHEVVAKLLEFGARMDDKDNKGYTILDRIVERYERQGTKEMLEVLGPLMTDQMLKDSIAIATKRGFLDPLDYALKKGRRTIADMNPVIIDRETGFNGLHCAVITRNLKEATDLLLQKNAQVNKSVADAFAMQPLHLAVLQEDIDMVKLLTERGAQVNGVDADGNTPLHLVANLSDAETARRIAKHLLRHGAQKNAPNKNGDTLLHLLVFYGNWHLIKELKKAYNLDDAIQNSNRETPRDMAQRLNRKSLLQYM